tara:strand:+ start:143 stop:448 length:306 start_codon:yes stop_codon:yes gene_type:complete
MKLVKLSEYQRLRRGENSCTGLSTLRRHAKAGGIPGAFQMDTGGDWWVDLETHDEIIRERISMNMIDTAAQPAANEAKQGYIDPVVAQILKDLGNDTQTSR